MGTRHLIAAVSGGAFRLAQYGQRDGYPSGQGVDVLNFLRDADLTVFRTRLEQCFFGTSEQIEAAYADFSTDGWMTMEQSAAFKASVFGHLSRDTGASILTRILESKDGLLLKDQSDFALDGLFCEWAYVIDFDTNTFEVYKGFVEEGTPIRGRWAGQRGSSDGYAPVDLVATFPLYDLPTAEEFLRGFEES